MPDLTLEEADRCPHCDAVLRIPPKCCEPMRREYAKDLKERADALDAMMEKVETVRAAIVAKIGPWSKQMRTGSAGQLKPCPACNKGTVAFSRAGSNGHIHARCTTPRCVSWVE